MFVSKSILLKKQTLFFFLKILIRYASGDRDRHRTKLKDQFMALTQQRKQEIMGDFKPMKTDTGSADVRQMPPIASQTSAHLEINQRLASGAVFPDDDDQGCKRLLHTSKGKVSIATKH